MTQELVTTPRKTSPTLTTVSPKQTRPRMVVVNFRVPETVKEAAMERAEREGINLSDVLRDHLTKWSEEK
jgi:predicted transcriptional regulator